MGHPQFEERKPGENLARVLVCHAATDDADALIPPLHPVEWTGLGVLCQRPHAGFDLGVTQPRVGWDHHVLERFALKGRQGATLSRLSGHLDLNRAFRVRKSRGGAQHNRRVELLAQLEGESGQVLRLLAIGRLEARELAKAGIVPVVLLVLGTESAGIVGADQHQARPYASVGERHHAVGGDVHANVFHRRQCTSAGKRGADSGIQRDLFVGGPFGHHASVLRQCGHDLRAGGAGISSGVRDASLPCPQRDGLISRKQTFTTSGCTCCLH